MTCRLLLGECVELLEAFEAGSVDSIVTDPPYEIAFMGKAWDAAGVSYQVKTWEAMLRVLKPGGHLLAFGGTRTYHRMTVAIEDAGFEIRDSLHWIYGKGFPKSLDVSKAIDKAAGAEREVVGVKRGGMGSGETFGMLGGEGRNTEASQLDPGFFEIPVTAPATEEAKRWEGWGTGLKPAHEPVVLARKPFPGTVSANQVEHGVGALNIDASRIGVEVTTTRRNGNSGGVVYGRDERVGSRQNPPGRHPANLLLTHLPDCKGVGPSNTEVLCAPGCPVAELNEMSGDLGSAYFKGAPRRTNTIFGKDDRPRPEAGFGDSGGAARFFWVGKPKKREKIGGVVRNLHPTVKPVELMRYLVRMVTPPGGVVLDPFLGSGSTGCAAMLDGFSFVGIEQDTESLETAIARIADYAFANGRERPTTT